MPDERGEHQEYGECGEDEEWDATGPDGDGSGTAPPGRRGAGGSGGDGNGGNGGRAREREPERSESLCTFGAVVQAFRLRAGITQEQLGSRCGYGGSTVAAIEQGRRFPSEHFITCAEAELDAFGALKKASRHLSRKPGLASWFRQWAKLEKTALCLYTYECRVVPGLLQTEAYARAVMRDVPPVPTEEKLEERLEARMDRQKLLYRDPPVTFSFIIEQSVLERRTGGTDTTRELLDHLIACAGLPNVELQIMPTVQPEHAGTDGPLQLLERPDHRWLAYAEGQQTGQLISDRKELSVLHMRYAKLRSQALTPADSLGLLERMRGTL